SPAARSARSSIPRLRTRMTNASWRSLTCSELSASLSLIGMPQSARSLPSSGRSAAMCTTCTRCLSIVRSLGTATSTSFREHCGGSDTEARLELRVVGQFENEESMVQASRLYPDSVCRNLRVAYRRDACTTTLRGKISDWPTTELRFLDCRSAQP